MKRNYNKIIGSIMKKLKHINERIWIVGFSGGKDSSLLVDIIIEYLAKTNAKHKVYIIFADTLLEYPSLYNYINKYTGELERFIKSQNIDVKLIRVQPEPGKDFLSYLLLRGYPMPHRRFRWCTEKLKIIPVKNKIKELLKTHEGYSVAFINGARIDESNHRKTLMKRRTGEEFTEKVHIYVSKAFGFGIEAKVFSPLAYLYEEDVWGILQYRRHPYFTVQPLYDELLKLYGRYGGKYSYAGKIRFGCWLCTVAVKDKSGEYLSQINKKTKLLVEARQILFSISHKHNELFRKKREICNRKYNKECYGSLKEEARYLCLLVFKKIIEQYPLALKSYLPLSRYNFIIKEAERYYNDFAKDAKKILLSNIHDKDIRRIYDFLKDYIN